MVAGLVDILAEIIIILNSKKLNIIYEYMFKMTFRNLIIVEFKSMSKLNFSGNLKVTFHL